MPDAAAGLHRQRRFLDAVENARKIIGDFTQHKAVEEGHVAVGAGSRQNPPRRLKAEIGHRIVERVRPFLLLTLPALLDGSRRGSHTPERILKRLVGGYARRSGKAIFTPPNSVGNRGQT